jgi:hypothetical protein
LWEAVELDDLLAVPPYPVVSNPKHSQVETNCACIHHHDTAPRG